MAATGERDWIVFHGDDPNKQLASGNGIDSLKAALPDDQCRFALYRCQGWLVRLHWKGPNCSAIKKVKSNGKLGGFSSSHPDSKTTVEVLAKGPLTDEAIWDRVKPGSGSKVIDDA
eukprot:CAMPEP_0119133800 /NCGR_PEP_ID=MMETSP1310-20130426/13629_1 /TAXON_ID=464262 /ORGANISM="Genus nov. species nov., Strain RCC2339" /LENGTH=115 /DNA_ID=CAMNT_0007124503 /DNA_START=53 /DNA_END=400 /DNA_ORIENTATION=-